MYNKKPYIILFFLFSILLNVSGQTIIWNKKANLPSARRNGAAIACNDKIYYIAGYAQPNTGPLNSIFAYDPATDSWQEKNVKSTKCSNLALATIDEKIYALGGDPFLDKNEVYDPAADSWESKASMPTKRQHINCGVVNGKIYVMGGLTNWSDISGKNECYDPATNTWEEKAPLPVPRHGPNPNVAVLNGIIYVIGGYGYEGIDIWAPLQTVQAYNTTTDQWSLKKEIPSLYSLGAIVINQTLYILTDEGDHTKIYTYDPAMNSWNYADSTQLFNQQAGITTLNNIIYYIGGNDRDFTAYADVFEGNLTTTLQLDSIDYFGQERPGTEPEIFAPGFISVDGIGELGITFSADGKEFCYSSDFKIYYMKKEDGNWTDPVIAYFVGDSGGVDPKFSPCGNLFTFQRDDDLYFCENINQEWSDPEPFPHPINTDKREGSASVTLDSILYFTSNNRSGNTKGDIYRSTYFKDSSTTAEKINTLSTYDDEDGLYIAQDESYIIFWSWRTGGYGEHDLYISFRDESGNWIEPQNLGNTINTNQQEISCSVSPDGEYLFFMRGSNFADFDVFWVDANIIEQFRPDTTVSIINRNNIIHESKLSQNYPNPFNHSTKISFNLPHPGFVRLKIYAHLGQEIKTLVNGFQTAGEHEIPWTVTGLPGGMYFYRLQVGEYYETRKMILEK